MKAILSIVIKIFLALMVVLSTGAISSQRNATAAGLWYVSTTGNDSNDCLSAGTACQTINGAVVKAASGDTILVAVGTYTTSMGDSVVVLDKNLIVSGGWDETFSNPIGRSIIDGEESRFGVDIPYGPYEVTLSRFVIQNGHTGGGGGGIRVVHGTLTIINSVITNNYAYAGGGGISILSYSTVYIKDSAIIGNSSPQWGGGIYSDFSDLTIENSTISENQTDSGGGGIVKSGIGSLHTYNTTISMNSAGSNGGGIWGSGDMVLKNTILADNTTTSLGQDCYLVAESGFTGGYNLIGDDTGCDFIPTTGDLVDVDPQLGALQDNGGDTLTQALSAGSLAIDHGDPAGCKDHLGSLITSDQRGLARENRCDIGAYEWQPPAPAAYQVYLPCITRSCSLFYYDNFSNPGSGWPSYNTGNVQYGYINNEYRILVKNAYWWAGARAPLTSSDYYVVADVRNASTVDGSYGLIFGLSSDWSQFYEFEIDTNGYYAIYQYQNEDWYPLALGFSPDIHTGMATNQVSIRRSGFQIWAYANGKLLNILEQGDYTGSRYTGLIASSYDQAGVDVRFDNYTMYSASCGPSVNQISISSVPSLTPIQGFEAHNHLDGNLQRDSNDLLNP
jgi:hypothetical protein